MGRNYRPPITKPEESPERTVQRIESLERVNAARSAGMAWEGEWERHEREYMVERVMVSPPPPPRKPQPAGTLERR
jgi:hypothetical protein